MINASGNISIAEGGTCPSDYYSVNSPGVMGCTPMNGGGSTFLPPSPGPKWQTRWGAIAWGGGGFGASNNLLSKRKAEKSAVEACRLRSPNPNQCRVYTAYYNQCIVVAQGENSLGTARSPEINEAKSSALEACRKTGDQFCKSAYDACSYPARIR
jgi:hypothetical protein